MRAKLTKLIFGLALCLAPGMAAAQVGTMEGRVVESDTNTPIPGVNVTLEGSTLGTAADADGNFRFTAPAGSYTLVATYVGYARYEQPVTVEAGGTTTVNIAMDEDVALLEELVVTALGIEREKRSLGYAVQEVESDVIDRSNEANLVNALAGKVAGVQVTSSSGQPGKASRITIRGNSSLLGNNQPLFVVDGVPISNTEDEQPDEELQIGSNLFSGSTSNRAVDIDPSIIEDISVLKGASATALYGSRAANGVVLITTKRGTQGQQRPRVTFSSRVGWDDAILKGFQHEYLQGTNGYYVNGLPLDQGGYVEPGAVSLAGNPITNPQTTLSWGPHRDSLSAAVLGDLGSVPVYDPREAFYRTGAVLENSVSLSGGGNSFNYFMSVADLSQQGIVPGTDLDRLSLMAKFGAQLTSQFNVETTANYITTENRWLSEGNGSQNFLYGLNFAPISFDIADYLNDDGSQRLWQTGSFNNPFWLTHNNGYASDVGRLIGSVRASYGLLPWLTVSERLGIDTYGDTRKEETNVGTIGIPDGRMYDQKITRREVNSDFTIDVNKDLAPGLNLTGLVGNNVNRRYYQFSYVRGQDLSIPSFFNISNASSVNGYEYEEDRLLASVYGQATFDYRNYLYLTLTARNDWSSTLPKGNNSYFYPSVSLGFVFTEPLKVFQGTPLSYGKLRASVAQIGSDAPVYSLSTNFIQANPGDGQRGNINFPFNGQNGYKETNVLGNANLKPEISTEYEVGLDLRFFGQRARLDAAYYNRSTRDQIFQVETSAATGFVARVLNAGEIRNTGVELTLGGTPVQTGSFAWDFQANFTKNKTKVVELTEGVDNIFLDGFSSPQIRVMPGENGYGVIWGSRYERDDRGRLLIDDDGYPVISNELGPIGNVQPDWLANFRTTVSFKGLAVSALLDVRHGGDLLNFDKYYTTFYGTAAETANRGTMYLWEGVNENTGEPNTTEVLRDETYYRAFYSSWDENFVEDGSFIKLREVSLSYTLPQSWVRKARLEGVTFTATGRNLWIDTDFTYGDPEGNLTGSGNGQGFYHMVTPGTKGISFGVRVTI